jgi:hypothetical protein
MINETQYCGVQVDHVGHTHQFEEVIRITCHNYYNAPDGQLRNITCYYLVADNQIAAMSRSSSCVAVFKPKQS